MRLSDHSHHVIIEGEMIIFDEIGDKYWILTNQQTNAVIENIKSELPSRHDFILELLEAGVLTQGTQLKEFNLSSSTTHSIDHHEWSTSFKIGLTKVAPLLLLRSSCVLFMTHIWIKFLGIHKTLEKLRNLKPKKHIKNGRRHYDIAEISSGVKQASKYLPLKTSCLQHSLAVCFLSTLEGEHATIKIGVKNYDFFAHAWIEKDGAIIGDRPDLPKLLHTILSI